MKPKIKYALAVALVAVMLLAALSGCTSDTPTGTTNPSSSTWIPGDTTGSGTGSTTGSTETTGGTEPAGTTAPDPTENSTISGTNPTEPSDTTPPTTENTTPTECQHSYGDWTEQSSATCTSDGSRSRTCSKCNDKQTEVIKATGHSYGSWVVTKTESCDTNGTQTRTCSKCNNKETQTIAATGHNWDDGKITSSSSDCSGVTIKTYTCKTCGKTKMEQSNGGNHAFGDWQYEDYTYVDEYGTNMKSHRKYHTCSRCGHKEYANIADHACYKRCSNHTVTTVRAGTCATPERLRSTCKICGWYIEYDGAKGKHSWNSKNIHLSDYGPYTNELDATISECTACGEKNVSYQKGEGWSDYNRYRVEIALTGNYYGNQPVYGNFNYVEHPEWQLVKRNFVYDSEGYVKQFTIYWWYNGTRYSQVINCGKGEIEKWFADCGLVDGENIKHYTLKCYGSYLAPYKVSYNY